VNHVSILRSLAALAALAFASGCGPTLTLMTTAPPNRVVTVDRARDRLELSEGVAVAIDCYRWGAPCQDMRAVSSSPDVAGVYPAHMPRVVSTGYNGDTNTTTLALVGLKPGNTTLRVWSEGYTRDYAVTVLPVEGVTHGGVAR
jgi:hypothetical protein